MGINLIKMIELLYLGIGLILGLFLAYFMNAAKPTKAVEADKEADWEDEVSLDSEDEQMTSDISFLTAKEYTDVMNTKNGSLVWSCYAWWLQISETLVAKVRILARNYELMECHWPKEDLSQSYFATRN